MGLCLALTLLTLNAPVLDWTFETEPVAWTLDGDVHDVKVTPDGLQVRVGDGPARFVSPAFELDPTTAQVVELGLQQTTGGGARCYWATDTNGEFGGFTEQAVSRLTIAPSDEPIVVRVYPAWRAAKRIVKLRFNLPENGTHVISFVRVLQLDLTGAGPAAWSFDEVGDWQPGGGVTKLTAAEGALHFRVTADSGSIECSPLQHQATPADFATCRLSTTAGVMGVVTWFGLNSGGGEQWFSLRPDGRPHVYNVELGIGSWRGPIVSLGLRLVDAAGAEVLLDDLRVQPAPGGAADLQWLGLHIIDGLPRVGRPFRVRGWLRNTGGEAASDVQLKLEGPGTAQPSQTLSTVPFGHLPFQPTWTVKLDQPGSYTWTVSADGVQTTLTADLTPVPQVAVSGVVPRPKPLQTPYLIGAYYMPGWTETNRWCRYSLDEFPGHTPLLGRYDERLPAVADWHLKWAVEHGVNVMLYDWFWEAERVEMEGALRAFLASRYRDRMKFALLWANHFKQDPPYLPKLLETVDYWSREFFSRPEHLLIDGRPAVFVFAPRELARGLGEDVAAGLEAARQRARKHGLKGLYFVACGARTAAVAEHYKSQGYDAISAYGYVGTPGGQPIYGYDEMRRNYQQFWREASQALPYLLPIMPGWDNRPQGNHAVVTGWNPTEFERMCVAAKQWLDARSPEAGPKMVVVKAFNEFPESSQLEPNLDSGFGNLDAVARVFGGLGEHQHVTPQDVGLGPYEVDLPLDRTRWEFREGWLGWFPPPAGAAQVEAERGGLQVASTGRQVRLGGPPVSLDAARFRSLVVRLRPLNVSQVTLRWVNGHTTGPHLTLGWNAVRVPVEPSEEVAEVQLDLGANPRWRLWARWFELVLDAPGPCRAELQAVRFEP